MSHETGLEIEKKNIEPGEKGDTRGKGFGSKNLSGQRLLGVENWGAGVAGKLR